MSDTTTVDRYLSRDLLDRLNDDTKQPREIRTWREAEFDFLLENLQGENHSLRVADFGCGDGRHLRRLRTRLDYGLGMDFDPRSIEKAKALDRANKFGDSATIEYLTTKAEEPELILDVAQQLAIRSIDNHPVVAPFTHSICMFNTILNISEWKSVFHQMTRILRPGGKAILSVYSERSVEVRPQWYEAIGEGKVTAIHPRIVMESGFETGHLSTESAQQMFGDVDVAECGDIGLMIVKTV